LKIMIFVWVDGQRRFAGWSCLYLESNLRPLARKLMYKPWLVDSIYVRVIHQVLTEVDIVNVNVKLGKHWSPW